jgi:hypothetical protein
LFDVAYMYTNVSEELADSVFKILPLPWEWRQQMPPKQFHPPTTSQNSVILKASLIHTTPLQDKQALCSASRLSKLISDAVPLPFPLPFSEYYYWRNGSIKFPSSIPTSEAGRQQASGRHWDAATEKIVDI